MKAMRVLIADDHTVVRVGIKEILREALGKVEFGEAETAEQALEHAWKEHWAAVILDVTMPGRSGIDILEEIKRERPRLPVLILSVHPEEQFARRALKAGASGYLTKDALAEELVRAVRKVLAGGRYVSASLAEKLASDLTQASDRPRHEDLSNREFQILRMIAAGRSTKEIAQELSLSVKTVSTYRARILLKLDLSTNAEIIRYALQHRLVT
jgi:two-component system, NarL family, invasion response regulator UvrY